LRPEKICGCGDWRVAAANPAQSGLLNVMDLNELLDVARTAGEPQPVDRSKVGMGGVDPLGLRQINFGLMDRVLPTSTTSQATSGPYTLMAWPGGASAISSSAEGDRAHRPRRCAISSTGSRRSTRGRSF
jgi:hypothetical protein